MADFYPLIANTTAGQIQEIPSTANLNLSGCNVINTGTYYGSGAGLTNIPAANVTGTLSVNTTGYAATVSTAAQPNITSVGTLSSLTVTANITSSTGVYIGNGAGLTNLTGANVTGTVPLATSSTTAGTVTTAAQPNITSVGTLSSLSVTANVAGGNITTAGQLVSTIATGTAPMVITSTTKVTNLNVEQVDGFHADQAGTVSTIVVRDSGGYANVAGLINSGANGVGNIGSSTLYFNTVFAKATSAQYADLAEMYCADAAYAPGTVVEFGGDHEITITTTSHSTRVAGIISTNPSYIMNSTIACEINALEVALVGRVPCQVLGPVNKGDVLVSSSIPGVAQRIGTNWQPGCTVGKAMEKIESSEVKVIEVAVGRL